MANGENYNDAVPANAFLRLDEEEQGLVPHGGFGAPVKKRRKDRFNGNGRDKLTVAEMKVQMSSLWKEGETYAAIAERVSDEFGLEDDERISVHAVQYHISSLLKSTKKMAQLHITERMALILARYDQLETLATEAYFASMRNTTTNYEKIIKQAKSKDREKQLRDDLKREQRRVDRINEKRKKNHKPLLKAQEPDPIFGELPEILVTTGENIKEMERVEDRPAGDPRWVMMLIDITDKRAALFGLKNQRDNINPDSEMAAMSDESRAEKMAAVLHAAMSRSTGDLGRLAPAAPLGGFQEGEEPDPTTMGTKLTPEEVIAEEAPQVNWDFD